MKLGDRVKDKISGFEGILAGYSCYLYGCERWLIYAEGLDKDGKPKAEQWMDTRQLEVVKEGVVPYEPEPTETFVPAKPRGLLAGLRTAFAGAIGGPPTRGDAPKP